MGGTVFYLGTLEVIKLFEWFYSFNEQIIQMNNYQTLTKVFSLTHGLISFFFNPIFPYPGIESIVMLFLFSICFACFIDMSSKYFFI